MIATSLVALALSAASVIAAPAAPYKQCPLINFTGQEHFGRTRFSATNDWLQNNPLKIVDDRGVLVSQTQALLNRDPTSWAETPGVGLLLVPAGAAHLEPLKLAIQYHNKGARWQAYVSTLKDETCVVPGSAEWSSVDYILNAEEKGKPLLDCTWTKMEAGQRYTNSDTEMTFEGSGDDYASSNSASTDAKNRKPAVTVKMIHHFGAFIEQDPAYVRTSKIAVDYVDIKGTQHTTYAIANKTPVKMQNGELNADVYSTGFCKVQGSETWAEIKAVHYVV